MLFGPHTRVRGVTEAPARPVDVFAGPFKIKRPPPPLSCERFKMKLGLLVSPLRGLQGARRTLAGLAGVGIVGAEETIGI